MLSCYRKLLHIIYDTFIMYKEMKFIILGHRWVFSKAEGLGHEIHCLYEGDFFGRMKFCQRINVHVCNTI